MEGGGSYAISEITSALENKLGRGKQECVSTCTCHKQHKVICLMLLNEEKIYKHSLKLENRKGRKNRNLKSQAEMS